MGMGDLIRIWNRSTGCTSLDAVEEKVAPKLLKVFSDMYVLLQAAVMASSSN